MKRSNLFFSLFVAALVFNTDLSAQRRGGGGNYGGGNRNVRSSANSSVNRNYNQNTNVNRNVNVRQTTCRVCHSSHQRARLPAVRQHLVSTPNVGNDDDLCRGQRAKMTHA